VAAAGDVIAGWTLLERLGRGGNGEVWRVSGPSEQPGAIKLLRRQGADRLARFLAEIRFLLEGPPRQGVMPVVDAQLEGDHPFYVMPVAVALREHLAGKADVAKTLNVLAAISRTLAALAAEGIGHRDLKPENLFVIDGEPVVGDFGLVAYPEKEPMTRSGRRLGPIDYMAPEMRADADSAAPEPADAYAFAKTSWVLLTERELPLPGPHRVDDDSTSLRSYIEHPRLAELDALLAASTRNDPTGRPTMAEVSTELERITGPVPEEAQMPDVSELAARVSELAAAANRAEEARLAPVRAAEALLALLNDRYLLPFHLEVLSSLSGLRAEHGPGYGFHTLLRPHTAPVGMTHNFAFSSVVKSPILPAPGEVLLCAIGLELVTAGWGVLTGGECRVVWVEQRQARLGSAAAADAVDELGAGLWRTSADALAALAERLR
jgi:serine/threonine protein kinase